MRAAQQSFLVPLDAPFLEIRTTIDSSLPYAEHVHSAFSLGVILEGITVFSLDGHKYQARKGELVFIPPWQPHSCNPVEGSCRSYHMLLFDAAWLIERVGPIWGAIPPVLFDEPLFQETVKVVAALSAGGSLAASGLVELLHRLAGRQSGLANFGRPKISGEFFRSTLKTGLERQNDKPPSVAKLAKYYGLRRESFSRAVKGRIGLPPGKFLHCLRLEQGRRLLRQGQSIAEAAAEAGYVDQSHFHRMFVKYFSVTPGRYQSSLFKGAATRPVKLSGSKSQSYNK